MTREEQIKQALSKYVKYRGVSGNHIVDVERDAAFVAGALYADRNPDLSSLWHDISEEPKIYEYILFEYVSNKNEVKYFAQYVTKNTYGILQEFEKSGRCRWAYITDLLPKGGER